MSEQEPERNMTVYVTADSSEWAVLDFKFSMISPPIIELHIPMKGTLQFFHATCYQLRIPAEAITSLETRLRSATVEYTTG